MKHATLTMIEKEENHAQNKHGDMSIDPYQIVTILTEEVGEVASAAYEWWSDTDFSDLSKAGLKHRDHMIKELAQVAAVAVRAMEALRGTR